ncbi:NAD(P)-binding protein [Daedalea quercina L-15889]|uniref:NAD(P)-binding protein n=1 Tax=Daedalea quercina L-15889 TaxID=1314783 RepID=A0A165SST1_9APHY|nr:NAD(P)-binding protein [Daedalea quercina L-15889]
MAAPKVWFITGSSSGFGRLMTERVLQHGDIAVATLRKPEDPSRLLILQLDVTRIEQIQETFAEAVTAFGRIDVVFNNAGYALLGEVEGTPDDAARAVLEVNLWGAVNVTREAIRVFREVNVPQGGRLLQVSSSVAVGSLPALGFYAASKLALEAIGEALAAELDPKWNIKVINLKPGASRTGARDNMICLPPHPAYTTNSPAANMRNRFNKDDAGQSDAGKVVEAIYAATALREPPIALPLGKDSITLVRSDIAKKTSYVDLFASWSDELGSGVTQGPEYMVEVKGRL